MATATSGKETRVLLHVAQSCYSVIGDKPFLWSKAKFDPRNFVLPGPIVTKLGTVDYVGDPYPYANFS